MIRICPRPILWNEIFKLLNNYAQSHPCDPLSPPVPLILNGWVYSNDIEKMQRWAETVAWAEKNGCLGLLSDIPDGDFHYADNPTSYRTGTLGGPTYRTWNFNKKSRPSPEQIMQHMETLLSCWPEIVGTEIGNVTRPLAFTGDKARRLLVVADSTFVPPWGGWSYLSQQELERRCFTRFRAAINKAIAPHEVDHIDFTTDETLKYEAFNQREIKRPATSFPEIEFVFELFCPYCGKRLFSMDSGEISKCPHLIFMYGWGGDPDKFLAVRTDFAQSFMARLLNSKGYQDVITDYEYYGLEPITKKDQDKFCQADFTEDDNVAGIIPEYFQGFPDELFPELLSHSTVIFKNDGYHSGIRVAIDSGYKDNKIKKNRSN